MHVCATMLSFKTMKSKILAILKFLYIGGTMTAILPLTVTLIIDHSYFMFTQRIILRTKRSKCRENFSQSPLPLKCGLNDNATILKILITYWRYYYYINYSHDYITSVLILMMFHFS
jgi:hypothetical protein